MYKIQNAELISLNKPTGDTSTTFMFPDIENIRRVYTQGIEIYSAEVVPKNPTGTTLQPYTDIQKGTLNLYINAGLYIQIPLPRLVQSQQQNTGNNGLYSVQPYEFNNIIVDWPKSFISLYVAATDAAKVFLVQVNYERIPQNGR